MIKRICDVIGAAFLLVALAPVLVLTAGWVLVTLGRPVVFTQLRPGFRGALFRMYKFRTMTDERDAAGVLLPNERRHTRAGAMLRRFSLDELPELYNVLRGDMSLVGPRPLLPEYLELYTPEQYRRHEVKPGITGLAQVSGRNDLTWERRFELDVWYVDHQSLILDCRILLRTIAQVISRRGINPQGKLVMDPFSGSDEGFNQSQIDRSDFWRGGSDQLEME